MALPAVGVHTVFEMLAYAVGFRVFLWRRARTAPRVFRNNDAVVAIAAAGAEFGAAIADAIGIGSGEPASGSSSG